MNNNVKDALRNYKRYKTRAHILDVIAMFPGKDPYFYWDVAGQSTDRTLYRKTNIVEFNLLSIFGYRWLHSTRQGQQCDVSY
jgi:hypothetical protein